MLRLLFDLLRNVEKKPSSVVLPCSQPFHCSNEGASRESHQVRSRGAYVRYSGDEMDESVRSRVSDGAYQIVFLSLCCFHTAYQTQRLHLHDRFSKGQGTRVYVTTWLAHDTRQ